MRILYIDPVFGMSGDMMISALIDAGVPFEGLEKLLGKIPPEVPSVRPVRLTQGVISGIHLEIGPSDRHLTIAEMEEVLTGIDAEKPVKDDAMGMLSLIVAAESKIHDISRDKLHLHELSHIDTVIDLLCVAFGVRFLAADKVFCGPVPCGSGTITTSHGSIPNPPPVTLEILRGHQLIFYDDTLELTTPTGAAIAAYYAQKQGKTPAFRPVREGYGVGTYKSSRPDVLRVFVGESDELPYDQEVEVIEADIDDMEMEYVGAVAERIRAAGALDVLFFPVSMKKGRMGLRLSVTTERREFEKIVEIIFAETTTFGMRFRGSRRRVLRREEVTVPTSRGPVRIKKGFDARGRLVKTHIEFEDVRSIADATGIPYREALEMVRREIEALYPEFFK
ncbi:MAG: nickel pincer cofactor biosynthesis protein LarC [Syntrophorhabdaceae bacterium]|nr:nickel pincer cofactor biosynthesis protein LarC [Syntrophorhabdaceae bacterium]